MAAFCSRALCGGLGVGVGDMGCFENAAVHFMEVDLFPVAFGSEGRFNGPITRVAELELPNLFEAVEVTRLVLLSSGWKGSLVEHPFLVFNTGSESQLFAWLSHLLLVWFPFKPLFSEGICG